ncbi:MAG: DUF4278 domain-containing protein [Leptolyngbyaceae cyanobacterium]
MKLTYRGISFVSLVAGVSTVETEQSGLFLGKSYALKQPPTNYRQASPELVYRGVRYSR